MEIDARFPAIQTSKTPGDTATDLQPVPSEQAAGGSDFFISPVLRFDSRSLTVIFQVRDSRSGDVIRQFPPETVVARYREDPSARPFVLPDGPVSDDAGNLPAPVDELGPVHGLGAVEAVRGAVEPPPMVQVPSAGAERQASPVDLVA